MEYKITEKGAFKVIGIRRTTPYGGGTWAIVKSNPQYLRQIESISGRIYDLGLCFGFLEDGSNDYMCAVEYEGENIPGLDSYTYAPHTWLEFQAYGKISKNVLGETWKYINTEFLPQSKYCKCAPAIERYILWDTENDLCRVDILLPIAIKSIQNT